MKTTSKNPIANIKAVEEIESIINWKFPADYVKDLKKFGAAQFAENKIKVGDNEVTLKSYLSVEPAKAEMMLTQLGRVGEGYVPFAFDVTGGLFCFDKNDSSVKLVSRTDGTVEDVADTYKGFTEKVEF